MNTPWRQFEAELPIGYTDSEGRCHRRGVLHQMRGHEEALLYDRRLNAGRLVTALLCQCLLRLGEYEPVTAEVAAGLYTADRNYLLLELRRITLGDHLQAAYRCPQCDAETALREDLSRLEVRRLAPDQRWQDITVTLEDGYVDRRGLCHKELILTLPRGVDEEFVASVAEQDVLRAQDVLLLHCIKQFGTLPKAELEAYGGKILRDLTLGDRQRLRQALDEQAPGVDLRRRLRCEHCGAGFTDRLDISNFFFASD